MEFIQGHVICGFRFPNGDICVNEPLDNEHRCEEHHVDISDDVINSLENRPTIHDKRFRRCHDCGDHDCQHFTKDRRIDVCTVERDRFMELMEAKSGVVNSGKIAATQFDSLVWDDILLDRILRALAKDGLTVTELKNYVVFEGTLEPIENSVEHPLLKHVPKLQQSATQLATVLKLTPKEQEKLGDDDTEKVLRSAFSVMMKESHKMFMAQNGNSETRRTRSEDE